MPSRGPMQEENVETLRENYVDIIDNLEPTQVIDQLYQNRSISSDEFESIQSCKNRKEKNRRLMYILRHRPEDRKAFENFKQSLAESHDFLKDQIEETEIRIKPMHPIMESSGLATYESIGQVAFETGEKSYVATNLQNCEFETCGKVNYEGSECKTTSSRRKSSLESLGSSKMSEEQIWFHDLSDKKLVSKYMVDMNEVNGAHGHTNHLNINTPDTSWLKNNEKNFNIDEVDFGPLQLSCPGEVNESYHEDRVKSLTPFQLSHVSPIANKLFIDGSQLYSQIMKNNPEKSLSLRDEAARCLYKSCNLLLHEQSHQAKLDYMHVSLKLALVRLGCGEYMQCIELQPVEDDLIDVQKRLNEVDSSVIKLPEILQALYYAVRCDLHFRRHNIPRALDYAEIVLQNCINYNWYQQSKMAECRIEYLKNILDESESATDVLVRQFDSDAMDDQFLLDDEQAKTKKKRKISREKYRIDKSQNKDNSESDSDSSRVRKTSKSKNTYKKEKMEKMKSSDNEEDIYDSFININKKGQIELRLSFSILLNIFLIILLIVLTILYIRA